MSAETNIAKFKELVGRGPLAHAWGRVYEYLALNGAKTGAELNQALGGGAKGAVFHRRAAELEEAGCLDKKRRVLQVQTEGRRAPNEYSVNGDMPEREKLDALKRRAERTPPKQKVLAKGVTDLYEICTKLQRDPKHKFSPEFMEMWHWLKTIAKVNPAGSPPPPPEGTTAREAPTPSPV